MDGIIMKEQVEETQERRCKSNELVQHMLKERNQLLSLMLKVSAEGAEASSVKSVADLEEFNQVLVDYIAAGHFGLYDRIAEGKERRKSVSELSVQIYPRIEQTTQITLAFDEKYNPENNEHKLNHFQEDLSMLGEELTTRIELEDQLIQLLLESKS
ncbi:MAG: regulator of sigma D [Gammaproteobacteria bacterium]|jgi:regulator of sigma D